MKKWLYICLTILASVLLMSHNTFATDITSSVEFYTSIGPQFGTNSWDCDSAATICPQSVASGVWYSRFYTDAPVSFYTFLVQIPKMQYKKGDYLVIPLNFTFSGYQGGNQTAIFKLLNTGSYPNNIKADLVDVEYSNFNGNTQSAYIYLAFWDDWNANVTPPYITFTSGVSGIPVFKLAPGYAGGNTAVSMDRVQVWRSKSGTDYSSQLQDIKDEIANQNQEEQEAVQDASDDAADSAASSSSDAAQGTASLLSAIGQAVSVISSASPTNCKLNGNMGHLNMGQIDLCSNPVPSFVSIIGSLILILVCVPLAISLFNRFINLFRSFTG